MTNEIELFYDKAFTNKIKESIEFLPIVAGEQTNKEIYIKNNLKYKVNLEISNDNNEVELSEKEVSIKPESFIVLNLSFNPKLTITKPISTNLKIKLNYIIS